ncbi:glutamate synthase-related protein [Candidatus Saccharibacteria bacterium]|nr:glutamate synthase-related protein [Candidatus Saccharibacteria bacterium]
MYRCTMCGYEYDEGKEGAKFGGLAEDWSCPVCTAPKGLFQSTGEKTEREEAPSGDFSAVADSMAYIQKIAGSGESLVEPAGTKMNIAKWDDILLMGAQLARKPIDGLEKSSTETVIGKSAKKPLVMGTPIVVSHMSYGALLGEQKEAIAKGARSVGAAIGSGEGGIYEGEIGENEKYIFEYVPNKYSVSDKNLKRVGAIEIKIGQSAKPGLGGHLPGHKVTAEIAKMRGREEGKDIISPPAFPEINTARDLKKLVDELREKSEGRPIGIKIAANNVEADMEWIKIAEPDFITVDGRGGGTGAAPKLWKDAAGIPTIYALHRARKFMDANGMEMELIITGGLRVSSDFIKALSMGADAVAVATGVLTAMAASVDLDDSSKVGNYLRVSNDEIKIMMGAMGVRELGELGLANLATVDRDIAEWTDIKHA